MERGDHIVSRIQADGGSCEERGDHIGSNIQVDGGSCGKGRQQLDIQVESIDISQYRLLFGFSLLYTDRVPFELLHSAALL
jgi:hypothetical protein